LDELKPNRWLAYTDLAWTEPILALPEEFQEESELLCTTIKEHAKIEAKTLLHLGCGAGVNDHTFKKHFVITGVDISDAMLEIARRLNPEVTYHAGDMRTVRLAKQFDVVAIPDSIGYMTSVDDLRKTIITAYKHLKPGGLCFIVAYIAEDFRENNFIYTGAKGEINITVFENNYLPDPEKSTYEATIVYLIRRKGELEIYTDIHEIGLFKLSVWLDLLKETGFSVHRVRMDHQYDRFLQGEGSYPLTVLMCTKSLLSNR
jgi:trans-aconitate methyltransferase